MQPLRPPQIAANRTAAPPATPWRWDYLRQRCLREASRILTRREDAEEAAQEALLRAWRLRDRCRHPDSRGAWVAKIARNEALRLRARRQAQPALVPLVPGGEPGAGPRRQIPASPAESELLDRLSWQDALARLAPQDRALIVLCYVGDITQASLANALGLPEVTVRVRLHRIRNKLGQVIGSGL